MKQIILIIVLFCSLFSNAQNQNTNNNKIMLRRFDIEKFNKLVEENGGKKSFDIYKNDGTSIHLYTFGDHYTEDIECYPFDFQYQYYPNGNLKRVIEEKYNCRLTFIEYDEQGNITDYINYNNDFKFSVDDVVEKMKDEWGGTLNGFKWYMKRHYRSNIGRSFYIVSRNLTQYSQYVYRHYLIDGNTGEFLSIYVFDHIHRPKNCPVYSPIDLYLNQELKASYIELEYISNPDSIKYFKSEYKQSEKIFKKTKSAFKHCSVISISKEDQEKKRKGFFGWLLGDEVKTKTSKSTWKRL